MFITLSPSRIAGIIPLIRPGDRAQASVPELKVPAYLDITSITEEGIYGTINPNANSLVKRLYAGWIQADPTKIYFAPWEKVERINMWE